MEITFKEIVKLIHPDSNPNITDASEKMTVVVRNRRDTKALWNLAVRWKLISGVENVGIYVHEGKATVTVNTDGGWDTGERPDYDAQYRAMLRRREAIRRQDEINRERIRELVREQHEETIWEVSDNKPWWKKVF